MATENWRQNSILAQLYKNPEDFNFFQAVRLYELEACWRSVETTINLETILENEPVRFSVINTMRFPESEINIIQPDKLYSSSWGSSLNMRISFMGLTGVLGVLPQHYTELILQRNQLNDYALNDFFDLFNHRIISLFYQAWRKNKFYINYEQAKLKKTGKDNFTYILNCLWGNGLYNTQNSLAIEDEAICYYAGLLHQKPHSAYNLKILLQKYFSLSVEIQPFQIEKLRVPAMQHTKITGHTFNDDGFNQLGASALLGGYIWSRDSKFRIRIGPLNYEDFLELLPVGDMFEKLYQLTSLYTGQELVFDLQLVLKKEEVPGCQLTKRGMHRLGWNTWLKTKPFQHDADQAILDGCTNFYQKGV